MLHPNNYSIAVDVFGRKHVRSIGFFLSLLDVSRRYRSAEPRLSGSMMLTYRKHGTMYSLDGPIVSNVGETSIKSVQSVYIRVVGSEQSTAR